MSDRNASESSAIVFVPRYDRNYIFLMNVAPFIAILLMVLAFFPDRRGHRSWLLLLSGPFVAWFYSQKYRRISFEDAIIIERPLFPMKRIEYGSVTGTGVQMLRTKQGNIYTGFFLNDDEFDDALDECRKRGYLTEEQLDLTYP